MRGAPQSGFARLIFRMRSRTSRDTSGLPGLPRLLFQVQYRRNPRRCQAMTVSGLTMMSAERQPDHRCSSHAHKRRSTSLSRTRPRCDLRSTFIWWRRARISNCKAARVWKQEPRVPRKERNRVNIGSGKLSSRSEPTSIISMRTEFLAGTAHLKCVCSRSAPFYSQLHPRDSPPWATLQAEGLLPLPRLEALGQPARSS